MSKISFNHSKQNVQDLIKALPAPASPKADRTRGKDAGQDKAPGFKDLLRGSVESQRSTPRSEPSEPVDTQSKAEPEQDEPLASAKTEDADQQPQQTDATDDDAQQTAEKAQPEQSSEQASSENVEEQPQETLDEVQLQADANAVSAQLALVQSVAKTESQEQTLAANTQQADRALVDDASAAAKQAAQAQSTASVLPVNGGASTNLTKTPTGPATQFDLSNVLHPILIIADQPQTSGGDTGGENKAATTPNSVNAATTANNNTAAAAAFTVPDQSAGESRIPVNPTMVTQTADAARQAQAQSAVSQSDNDSLNTARLTRGLANAVQQRGGAVTLRLTPPEMGTVRIQMQITGTNVSASFHAESSSAQTLLTNQLAQLRSALESKGMSVERLSVQPMASTAATQNSNQSQNQSDAQQQNQSQQQNAGEGRSRGQYNSSSSGRDSSDQQQGNGQQQARRGFFDRLSDATGSEAA